MYDVEMLADKLQALGVKSKSDIAKVMKEIEKADIEAKIRSVAGTANSLRGDLADYVKAVAVAKTKKDSTEKKILVTVGAVAVVVAIIGGTFVVIKKCKKCDKLGKSSKKCKWDDELEDVEVTYVFEDEEDDDVESDDTDDNSGSEKEDSEADAIDDDATADKDVEE